MSDSVIGHCVEGSVVSAGDCSKYGAWCSTAGGAAPRCVSASCVEKSTDAPAAHDVCLPSGWLAHCNTEGGLENAAECPAGQACSGQPTARCVAAGSPDAGAALLDAGRTGQVSHPRDASTPPDADQVAEPWADAGVAPAPSGAQANLPVTGGCSAAGGGGPGLDWIALVGLARWRRRGSRVASERAR